MDQKKFVGFWKKFVKKQKKAWLKNLIFLN